MAIKEMLLPEFDQEMATTRRVLERIPLPHSAWKPHAKSMDMGSLAAHLVEILEWVKVTAQSPSIDMAQDSRTARPTYATNADLVAAFDRNVAQARAAIAGMSDKDMAADWTLLKGGTVLLKMPKLAVLRSFVLNHMIHHRGQASVYLRMKDIPVPSIYGPSADESGM